MPRMKLKKDLRRPGVYMGQHADLSESEKAALSVVNVNNVECSGIASASNPWATFSTSAVETLPQRRSL